MRTLHSVLLYSVILLFLPIHTAAWPWPKFLPALDSLIMRRDDAGGNANQNTTATPLPASTSGAPQTSGSVSMSITATPTSGSAAATSETPTTTDRTSYDPRLPAGGISMTNPPLISGSQYYRIGDFVTFGWNYTSLLATPTALDILASCSANNQIYTLAMNQSADVSGAVTWDTGEYQATATVPLLTETYTLIIYDADSSISAAAQAGYLASFNSYQFGMYIPQPYTPLSAGFQCVTCSGALSEMERQAVGFMFGMAVITILSFTWFVHGLNVIW